MISRLSFGQTPTSQPTRIQTTPEQQARYQQLIQGNVDWALNAFQASIQDDNLIRPDGNRYHGNDCSKMAMTAAIQILNRAFPGFNSPLGGGHL